MAASNLNLRILSALVLIPVVFGVIFSGGWSFGIFVALIFGLCSGEWFEMTATYKYRFLCFLGGFLYFLTSCTLFVALRIFNADGFYLVMTLMLCVWGSDTVAYIMGRWLGGPKLAPKISPNKTWAGLAGAMLGAAAALCAMLGFADPANLPKLFVYGCALGAIGQAGDLLESYMKRRAGVKDSGSLIPGHGGILDRVDALLLMIPAFYALIASDL